MSWEGERAAQDPGLDDCKQTNLEANQADLDAL